MFGSPFRSKSLTYEELLISVLFFFSNQIPNIPEYFSCAIWLEFYSVSFVSALHFLNFRYLPTQVKGLRGETMKPSMFAMSFLFLYCHASYMSTGGLETAQVQFYVNLIFYWFLRNVSSLPYLKVNRGEFKTGTELKVRVSFLVSKNHHIYSRIFFLAWTFSQRMITPNLASCKERCGALWATFADWV